jgi:excisionase family DNA binding protein
MSDSDLLTLEEARLILRFSPSKLYQERRSGRLKSRAFGRSVRIHRDDLQLYIKASVVGGTESAPKVRHQAGARYPALGHEPFNPNPKDIEDAWR